MPKKINLSNYDWFCDECNASLDEQPGFNVDCGTWKCKQCGCINYIDEYNIEDKNEAHGYCNSCEHGSEFPKCKSKCPYELFM